MTVDEERSISENANCRSDHLLELTSDANRLPCTPVLQGHQFIRKNNGAVKSTSDFVDGNKIKGTLRSIKDKSER